MNDAKINDPSMDPKDNTKPMIWAKMKEFVNGLSDEQLKEPLRWWGDERGGVVTVIDVLSEDYYRDDEYTFPESEIDKDDPDYDTDNYVLSLKKGTPMISVD